MSSRIAFALLFFTGLSLSASHAAPPPGCPTLSYDTFPVAGVQIKKEYDPGKAWNKDDADTPAPDDFPPNTSLTIHNPAYSKQVQDSAVYIYNLTKIYTAPQKTIRPQLKLLKKMLADRSTTIPLDKDSGSFSGEIDLPDYPASDCSHLFQKKLHYVDMPWGSGVGYITVFCQDIGPITNEDLSYVFMGVSKDGKYMISVMIHLTHPKLAKSYDSLPKTSLDDKGVNAYNAKAIPMLSNAADSDFSPAIGDVEKWIASLKFE